MCNGPVVIVMSGNSWFSLIYASVTDFATIGPILNVHKLIVPAYCP